MRKLWAAFAMVLLAGLAAGTHAGDDKPAPPKPQKPAKDVRVYTEEEWIAKAKDLQKVDIVGVKRAEVMAYEAARSAVRVRVKIWDIRATQHGPAVDIMDVVPRRGGPETLSRDPIVLSAEDRETIKDWKRWDRLAFKVKPSVTPDGAFSYTREIGSAADIDRTPNPGIEYVPSDRPLADADSFDDWVGKYTRACAALDWRNAWKTYARATYMSFPVTATVREGVVNAETGRGPRGPAGLVFDILRPTGVTGYGYLDAQGHPCPWARVQVDDPQAIEALKTGARAELLFRVHGLPNREDLEVREGHFRVEVTFGRVK